MAKTQDDIVRFDNLAAPIKLSKSLLCKLCQADKAPGSKGRVQMPVQSIRAQAFRGEPVPSETDLARSEGHDYEPAAKLIAWIRKQHHQRPDRLGRPKRMRKRVREREG